MRNDKLSVLSMRFSVAIVHLSRLLREKHEYVISNQLEGSGLSIGANIREAHYAQSRADFISKLQIALKEANETGYWLDLLHEVHDLNDEDHKRLTNACSELRVLLIRSISTAKANMDTNKPTKTP